jgi:sugar lactone lactonase YvrE
MFSVSNGGLRGRLVAACAAAWLAACGGGSGGATSSNAVVGGTIKGVHGAGLALSDGRNTIAIAPDQTTWVFPSAYGSGQSFNVTLASQESSRDHHCEVSGGSGIAGGTSASAVVVDCSPSTWSGPVIAGHRYPAIGAQPLDDGPAAGAHFEQIVGLARAADGTLYIADNLTDVVRRLSPDQATVSSFAGASGLAGEVGPQFVAPTPFYPEGLVVDAQGAVFATDGMRVIWKVTPGVGVAVFAGSPTEEGLVDGVGQAARFNGVNCLAIDEAGNLYASDANARAVRRITPDGVVTTLAGGPEYGYVDGKGSEARFGVIEALAVDHAGNVWAFDFGATRMRKIAQDGSVSTVFGQDYLLGVQDGPIATASARLVLGMAFDQNDNLFFTEQGLGTVRKLSNGRVTTVGKLDRAVSALQITPEGDLLVGTTDGEIVKATWQGS